MFYPLFKAPTTTIGRVYIEDFFVAAILAKKCLVSRKSLFIRSKLMFIITFLLQSIP